MENRQFHYLMARLRHEAWRRSIQVTIDAGFIQEEDKCIEGFTVRVFHSCTAIPEVQMRKFESLISRFNANQNKCVAIPESDYLESTASQAWSGPWMEPDTGTKKLTGYRPGSQGRDAQTANMSTIVRPSASQPEYGLTAQYASLLHRIRCAGRLLGPVDVATVLLVTKAIEKLDLPFNELSAMLSDPGLIVSVFGGVEGFERSFMSLMKRGIFGPPSVVTFDGTTIGKRGQFVFPKEVANKRVVITFLGSETDPKYAELADWQLGRAAELGVPVLGVTEEKALLPERMLPASRLCFATGPITSSIVHDTIGLVLGTPTPETLNDRSCALLTLSDLALAIRPGIAPDRAIATLKELALSKAGDGSLKSDASGTSGPAQIPKTGQVFTGNHRKQVHSGSEIIQPQQGPDANAANPTIEILAGYGDAKTWAVNLKEDLDQWKAGQLSWTELSSRIVLCGPPGTGKTLFAKALTNTLGIPLYATSVGIWLEAGHLGDVLERMRAAFAEAKSAAPCILFIDETDGIGGRRSGDKESSDFWNNVITRLLELLDGTVKSTGVIIVGATNKPDAIDPALLRSGRLEKRITIPLPDIDALAEMLRFHLAAKISSETENLSGVRVGGSPKAQELDPQKVGLRRLATMASGMTGADIERIVREARGVARRDKRRLSLAHVEATIVKDKPKRKPALQQISAIHEAGHAIACHAFGNRTITSISLNGKDGRAYVRANDNCTEDGTVQSICDDIVSCLAGRAAEEVILGHVGRGSGGGLESDLAKATEMACSLETSYGCNSEHPLLYLGSIEPFTLLAGRQDIAFAVNDRLEACYEIAKELIGRNRDAVKGLADMLLVHETLEGAILSKTLDGLIVS